MKPGHVLLALVTLSVIILAAGCIQPASPPAGTAPVVYIIYGSEKGDLSYTDAAHRGLTAAQKNFSFTAREFTPKDYETIPALLNSSKGDDKPGLIISVGFQYANFTQQLAQAHPDIRFLSIDQAGIGSDNIQACEITSYGDSFLAGALAASATRTGHVGILMGMKTELLDTFIRGYTDGARAVNASVIVDHAYVHRDSVAGFTDPEEAGRIAGGMYSNGTDVIFVGAGYSIMGPLEQANRTPGRYIIATDSDQSSLGPRTVLASAVKRVDHVVYSGISEYLNGTFNGGNRVAGLAEGSTGLVYNPAFATYTRTTAGLEGEAGRQEAVYLASRGS